MRRAVLLSLIVLMASVALAQTEPHVVFGALYNSDGSYPAPACIVFQAWVTTRPGEILTQESLGCAFEDSLWFVNVGNFPTPIADGDELTIVIRDTCENEILTITGTVDLSYPEEDWGPHYLEPEGLIVPEILILTPNGGDSYIWDDPIDITWESTDLDGDVKIEYSPNDGGVWVTIALATEDDGIFEWVAPHITSDQVLFKVSSVLEPGVFDISDDFTEIGPPPPVPTIEIVYPNGGEVLTIGEVVRILWDVVDHVGPFELHVSYDAGDSWIFIEDGLGVGGMFDWTVVGPASERCLVRVRAEGDHAFFDVSDALFEIADEIVPPVEPTLIRPNGGEVFWVGDIEEIRWDAGDYDDLELHVSRNNGGTWELLADGLGDEGTLNWLVTGPVSEECLMRIRSASAPGVFDISDALFEIAEEIITPVWPVMIYPNGREVFFVDSLESIRWDAGDFDNLELLLSRDGGETWELVADGLGDEGTFNWTVTDPVSEECLMRIRSADIPAVFDDSDELFEIAEDEEPIPDIIPPAAFNIDTIPMREVSFSSFRIYWIAPGDDGNVGTADLYDFRLSTTPFVGGEFEGMPLFTAGVPAPAIAGTPQTLNVTSLTPNTDYWIAGRALDEVPNAGAVSNILHVRTREWVDVIPVGDIRDLTCASHGRHSIELTFTAPGDDGMEGIVGVGYEVRYTPDTSFAPIMWPYVEIFDTIPPVPPRTLVTYIADGLDSGRFYSFVIRGLDDDGPDSNPSTVAGCWTLGVVAPLADIVMTEDDPDTIIHNIPNIFNPPFGLEYNVTCTEEEIAVSLIGNDMKISLAENYFGEGWIIITAGLGEEELVDSVHITVNPVNDAPIFVTFPDDTIVIEGGLWNYMAIATDVEDDPVSYGLISGPVGMEVDISGYANWAPMDIEGTFRVRIGAWDDFDTTIQEFNITVIKYTHPLFAPQNLDAWDGFRDCVPVVWETPEAVRLGLPVNLSHYTLYRSTSFDIGYTVLADSVLFNSYCDNTVEPGVLYFYKAKAVYRAPDFTSAFSNIDGGASLASRWLYSNYNMMTPPIVDGDLNEAVWFGCTNVNLFSDFDVLLGNSGSMLYIGLMNYSTILRDGYKLRFFFDDDYNQAWDADSSTEGYYEVTYHPGGGSTVEFYPLQAGGSEPPRPAVGAFSEWQGDVTPGFSAELIIDMTVFEEFFALPSDTVGVAFQILNEVGDTILNWPTTTNPLDPTQLAHLVLGSPGGLPTLMISPPILLVDLETEWTTNRTIRLRNTGDGTIIWNAEGMTPWLELTPSSGTVPPGTILELDAKFISGLMPVGTYTTSLEFFSNDPLRPVQELPVELNITPRVPRHYLEVYPPATTTVTPGGFVEIPIIVGEVYDNEIYQLDFTVSTDRAFLIPLSVMRGAALPADWTVVIRNIYNDRVLLRLYGPGPLPSSGDLIKVRYAVNTDILDGRSSRIEVSDLLLNYGFEELPIPVPGDGVIIVGDELRYYWYGLLNYFIDGVLQDSVRFGILDAATNDYDRGIDILNTPPHSLLHDAWFISDDWRILGTDIRPTGQIVRWELWVESDGVIEWDPRQMWPGVMINGEVDMSVESSYRVSTEAPVIITYDGTPGTYIWNIDLKQGWNLISPPIQAPSMSISALFPTALGSAYGWDPTTGSYIDAPTISIGEGFWVLSSKDTSYTRSGNPVYSYARDLPVGWLLLGSPAHRTYLDDQYLLPSNSFVPGTFYKWDAHAAIPSYVPTEYFTPGLGQWIYCRFPAEFRATCIYLPKDGVEAVTAPIFEGELFLDGDRGQRVIFSIGNVQKEFPIPPPAPGATNRIFIDGELPLMESRLTGKEAVWTGRIVVSKEQAVKWRLSESGSVKLEIDGVGHDIRNSDGVLLGAGSHSFKVTYSREVPEKIALLGNTPNPFNAATAIAFQLPSKEHVSIEVFDIAGRRVIQLADGEFGEGVHRLIWNGREEAGGEVPSGVYFVVMKAGGQSYQRKMLLVK